MLVKFHDKLFPSGDYGIVGHVESRRKNVCRIECAYTEALHQDGRQVVIINEIYTECDFRKSGYATLLLKTLISNYGDDCVFYLQPIPFSNAPAMSTAKLERWYSRLGFESVPLRQVPQEIIDSVVFSRIYPWRVYCG